MINPADSNELSHGEIHNIFSFSIISATIGIVVGFIMLAATVYVTVFVGT